MVDFININSLNISSQTIIYSRSSTKKQNDFNINSASINTQIHSCLEFCKNNKLDVKFMRSETCSARNCNNQKKLLEIIENYENINLVIFDISRFSRNISDGIKIIEKCFKNNIIIYFVKEELKVKNKNDLPKFTSQLINAHIESDTISYRLTESIKYRKSLGNHIGKAKYGYNIIKENNINKIIENTKEQLIIQIILKLKFGCLISELDKITKKLNNTILNNIDRQNEIIMYGHYGNTSIADILNDNNIKYKDNNWISVKINNIITTNLEDQDKKEKILDAVFFEFSKFLTRTLKLTQQDKTEISNILLKQLSSINDYKLLKTIKKKIKNISDIQDIVNILNSYNINFRVWTDDDIYGYISDNIKINKKRKLNNETSI